jgi:hypothetical protein
MTSLHSIGLDATDHAGAGGNGAAGQGEKGAGGRGAGARGFNSAPPAPGTGQSVGILNSSWAVKGL